MAKKNVTVKVAPGNPTRVVAGGPGKSEAQKPMPGPTNPGQPISMKKALARKPMSSKGL